MSKVRLKFVLTVLVGLISLTAGAVSTEASQKPTVLRELVVSGRQKKFLHILGYVREYSTLSTFTDTVFMFREKLVDYLLPSEPGKKNRGWSTPRVLSSRSYYRFTDINGLDSVSDRCSHHFSWADWVGIVPATDVPAGLRSVASGSHTDRGKYSPAVVWTKEDGQMTLDIDVLADTIGRRWVPNLGTFFRKNTDFERFRLNLNYDGVVDRLVSPVDMTGYSFYIESNGRGRGVYVFDRLNVPYSVSTYAEVYLTDKEYITSSEAKKWEKNRDKADIATIYEAPDAPELDPDILSLIARVNAVDRNEIRSNLEPNKLLKGRRVVKLNFGQAVLQRIKSMFGIDHLNAERKWRRSWNNFRRDRLTR